MFHALLALSWNPGIRGILDVAIAVAVLCGTPLLLLITNNGARLGFHLAVTGLFGWLTLMFLFWVIFGIGFKGPAPAWRVIEVSTDTPNALHAVAHNVPQPGTLPTPASYLKTDAKVHAALAAQPKAPTLGDVVAANPEIATELSDKLNGWRIVSTSNAISGDAGATATTYLIANGVGTPLKADGFVLGAIFDKGGKPTRTNQSIVGRVAYRAEKLGMWLTGNNPTHYAVQQAYLTLPQTILPGQPPPTPEIDPAQPVVNVIMVRSNGATRLPGTALFFFSLVIFSILAYQLHRRDKAAMAARAAAASTKGA
jgi:hypothetical protein